MQAIATSPGRANSVRIIDLPGPSGSGALVPAVPGVDDAEVEVATVEVGVCGTDLEIVHDGYGQAPTGQDRLVLGHENLGRVATAPDGSGFHPGQLVVATVRRPCPERCPPCAAGQSDDCLTGHYTERGILGRDGYMAERYVERASFLVPLPETLARVGVLMEPSSIVEKGLLEAEAIQRARLPWAPRQAVVCGAGAIGLLAALFLRLRGLEVTLIAKSSPESLPARLAAEAGARLWDADDHPIDHLEAELGNIDLVFEATGVSAVALQAISALGRNAVCCLSSVTAGHRTVSIDADSLNLNLVLGNKLVFGTVNANRRHFTAAARSLEAAVRRWPGLAEQIVTRRVPAAEFTAAFDRQPDDIKTVVTFQH
ncbi:MAG TPA: glucose 1-dehydrogenase [Candidatus Dormibacteraeota bacterium]|nr:glucose 1-dehydrogenase [Candidatus Dormibacteraeota bacterium]